MKLIFLYFKHLLCLLILLKVCKAAPEVTIAQGTLKGSTYITDNGFPFDAFMGIPYAQPPLGDLRFKEPQPADGWEGVFDASVETNVMCPQINTFFNEPYSGVEDCLYLNVYAPQNLTVDSNLPIMVWIHGGGFDSGSGIKDLYGPDYLVDKNVIVVTFNYRLGSLGFLCLHSAEVPGNAGMKDQVLALQWVKDNIKQFGGDPKQVTIFGESAGSASVHYIMMSTKTHGLFSKAILESGASFNEWALQYNPLEVGFAFGKLLGLETDDKDELFNFLKTIPAEILTQTALAPELSIDNTLTFSPVVEKFVQMGSFLTENPKDLLQGGKYNIVPTISGFMSNEGAAYGTELKGVDTNILTLDMLIPDFEVFIPKDLKGILNAEKRQEVADKIKQFYFETEDNLLEKLFAFLTDYSFVKDIDTSVNLLHKHDAFVGNTSTYYFKFSYSGSLNLVKYLSTIPYEGAAHADEMGYLFKFSKNLLDIQPTDLDKQIIDQMTEMWTNFAKFGNPTPQLSENIKVIWDPLNGDGVNCLDINEEITLIKNPYQERIQFWADLYQIHNN